jgi:hypothetical protein
MGFWPGSTYDDHSQWQENYEDEHSQRRAPQGPDPYVEANRLREQNTKYVQIIQQLQTSLKEEQAVNDKVKQSANRMQLAMDNKELFVGVQHTDDVVLGKFQNLLGQIKTWSTKFVNNGSLELERLETRTVSQFRLVAPGCFNTPDSGRLFDSGKKRRMFIRGWVTLVMTEAVFRALPNTQNPISSGGDRWMGKQLESSVTLIEDRLSYAGEQERFIPTTMEVWGKLDENTDPATVSLRDLHDWRALTVELLSRIDIGKVAKQEMEDYLKTHSRGIMQVIGGWAPPEMKIELEESIFNIFHSAVQFSQLIRRQRACWYVRGPAAAVHFDGQTQREGPHDILFDKTCMRDDDDVDEGYGQDSEEKARKVVELVICPGLFKRGNADGERFDTESCIVQQLVLCRNI